MAIAIVTLEEYKNSRINQINKNKIIKYLKGGGIPIITGFQRSILKIELLLSDEEDQMQVPLCWQNF